MVDWTEKHGRENGPFVRYAREIASAISADHYTPPLDMKIDSLKIFDESIRSKIKSEIDQWEFPEIVKFPNEGWLWLIDLFDPELVIVTYRSPTGWMDSMERWDQDAFEKLSNHAKTSTIDKFDSYASIFGHTVASLEYHKIDYTIAHYPRSATEPTYLHDTIKPALDILGYDFSINDIYEANSMVVRKDWIL